VKIFFFFLSNFIKTQIRPIIFIRINPISEYILQKGKSIIKVNKNKGEDIRWRIPKYILK
jgi:hypothetical protein